MAGRGVLWSDRAALLLGWGLGAATFVYLMALPPTLNTADESFILYGAKRVYQGQALYRDFFDFLTPGSFYLYALSYAVGGVSITSARVTTALLNAISAVCTYFLARRVASSGEALIAGLLVAVICVPVWNMASHHWIATAFGLASPAVLLAPRWRASERARPFATGALAGVLVSTHQNRGLLLIAWLVVAIPLLALASREPARARRCVRALVWTAVGGAVVCVPVFGYAIWRSSLGEMMYATHEWVVNNYRNYNVGKIRWAGSIAFANAGLRYTYLWLMRAIPTLLLVEAVMLAWALWHEGLRAQVMRLVLFLFALSAVGGIVYFPDIVHVAFVVPAVSVVLAGMVYRARTAFAWTARPAVGGVAHVGLAVALALVLAKGWANFQRAWEENPVLYETAYGTLAGSAAQAATIRDLREKLSVDPAAPPRLFAHSTDAWIYLALPADNPTPFALLRPVYNTPAQIQQAIDDLEHDRAAVVLLNVLSVKKDDPVVQYLRKSWEDGGDIGPPAAFGQVPYRLFVRGPGN